MCMTSGPAGAAAPNGRATTTGARGGIWPGLASRWPFDPMMIIPSVSLSNGFPAMHQIPAYQRHKISLGSSGLPGIYASALRAHITAHLPVLPAPLSLLSLQHPLSLLPTSHGVGLASSVLPVESAHISSRSVACLVVASSPQNNKPLQPPRIGWTPPCAPPSATTTASPTCSPTTPAPAPRALSVVCQTSRWVERGVMNLPLLMLVMKMAKMMTGMRKATLRRAKRKSRKERNMTTPRPVTPRRNK